MMESFCEKTYESNSEKHIFNGPRQNKKIEWKTKNHPNTFLIEVILTHQLWNTLREFENRLEKLIAAMLKGNNHVSNTFWILVLQPLQLFCLDPLQ